MDKKKVIELIGNVEKYLLTYEESGKVSAFSMALQQLHEAEDELSKPDWISVEDELPEYWEKVLVTDKEHPNHVWISHREDEKSYRKQDKNGFPLWKFSYPYYEVTHWRKIDKLEV